MTFAEAVDAMRKSGVSARRSSWSEWRKIWPIRRGKGMGSEGMGITLNPALTEAELSDGQHPDYFSSAFGYGGKIGRWRPQFRDLIATDWVVEVRK